VRGFDAESRISVPEVPVLDVERPGDVETQADTSVGGDDVSQGRWKTIACHSDEVVAGVTVLADALGVSSEIRTALLVAARWHDAGKAHPAFQGAIRAAQRPDRQDLAKAPQAAWLRPPGTYRTADNLDVRSGLRHELASAMALFDVLRRCASEHEALLGPWSEALRLTGQQAPPAGQATPSPMESEIVALSAPLFDLAAYLVAAHHGKVRASLHASPKDQDYRDRDGRGLPVRGVRDGDTLPAVALSASGPSVPELTLSLQPATLGLSPLTGRSWRERTGDLRDRFGPGALAFLEALIVAADRRASRLVTEDPVLLPKEVEG